MGLPNAGSSPSSKPSQRAGGRGVGRAQWPHPARECHALLQYRGGEDALCAWTFGRVRRHSWRPQRNAPRSRKSGTSAPARLTSIAPALPSLGRVRRHEERQVANSFSGLRRRPNARRRLVPPRRAQLLNSTHRTRPRSWRRSLSDLGGTMIETRKDALVSTLLESIETAKQSEWPYRSWFVQKCLPSPTVQELLALPFEAPALHGISGKRE